MVEIHEQFWRVEVDGRTVGWVRWVPSPQGFHYRALRFTRRGPGVRTGEFDRLQVAAESLVA